jgi:hypothetical protein
VAPRVIRVPSPHRRSRVVRADPVVRALSGWLVAGLGAPRLSKVRGALALLPAGGPQRANVVCLGDFEVPDVGDFRFEPEILSATRLLGHRLMWSALAIGILAAWFMLSLGSWAPRPSVGMWFLVPVLSSPIGVWLWRSGMRARFVRLAPGMIQVLVYRWPWSAVPTVRSYPMSAGTLVVAMPQERGLAFTLARGKQRDVVSLRWLSKGDAALERVWHALLSTAPTPPLSETRLVG